MKNQYRGGDCLKRGAWTVCRFKEGLGKKEGEGVVFEKGLISQCTLCTMEIFSVVKVKGCLLKMKKE